MAGDDIFIVKKINIPFQFNRNFFSYIVLRIHFIEKTIIEILEIINIVNLIFP